MLVSKEYPLYCHLILWPINCVLFENVSDQFGVNLAGNLAAVAELVVHHRSEWESISNYKVYR